MVAGASAHGLVALLFDGFMAAVHRAKGALRDGDIAAKGQAIGHADFIIVAVPTPVDDAHQPDFTPLVGASQFVGKYMKRGATVYARTCIACHQPTGMGLPPVFPPLAKAPIAVGNPELPIKFILQGLMGPITVGGTTFNSMMPPVPGVNDQDIADVLTYVRQSFGNKGNPVSVDQVKAVRAATAGRTAPWTTAELGLK